MPQGSGLPRSKQALDGIRVVELGTLIAGPLCSRILADFGAEVIKVEDVGVGDPLRNWGEVSVEGESPLWYIYSRNKKCVTANLRKPEGQELVRQLLATSDIVVENFRPGTLEKWRLGDEALRALNPRLIIVHVSGFGQSGPYRDRAGFGSIGETFGGIRYTTGSPDRPPARTGVSLGDSLASLFGVIGALLALQSRSGTGLGQVVDVAIYEAVFALMESVVPEYVLAGKLRERSGSILPGVAPSNVYPCADNGWIAIAANANNVFRRLVVAMGKADLADDEKFATHQARGIHQDELDSVIANWTRLHTRDELQAVLDEAGVPAGPIYTAEDMVKDPHFAARDMIVQMVVPRLGLFPMPGTVPKLSDTPGRIDSCGALLGSHNDEVYGSILGIDRARLGELAAAGVI